VKNNSERRSQKRGDGGTQNKRKGLFASAEAVSFRSRQLQARPAYPVVVFGVADHDLVSYAATHLATDSPRDWAELVADPGLEPVDNS
jgi:hypothetical protein